MKITIEETEQDNLFPRKATIELSDHSNIHEVIDDMCRVIISYGFSPQTVDDGILGRAEEIELSEDRTHQDSG